MLDCFWAQGQSGEYEGGIFVCRKEGMGGVADTCCASEGEETKLLGCVGRLANVERSVGSNMGACSIYNSLQEYKTSNIIVVHKWSKLSPYNFLNY